MRLKQSDFIGRKLLGPFIRIRLVTTKAVYGSHSLSTNRCLRLLNDGNDVLRLARLLVVSPFSSISVKEGFGSCLSTPIQRNAFKVYGVTSHAIAAVSVGIPKTGF